MENICRCENCKNFRINLTPCSTDRETQWIQDPECLINKMLFVNFGCKYFKEKEGKDNE